MVSTPNRKAGRQPFNCTSVIVPLSSRFISRRLLSNQQAIIYRLQTVRKCKNLKRIYNSEKNGISDLSYRFAKKKYELGDSSKNSLCIQHLKRRKFRSVLKFENIPRSEVFAFFDAVKISSFSTR